MISQRVSQEVAWEVPRGSLSEKVMFRLELEEREEKAMAPHSSILA